MSSYMRFIIFFSSLVFLGYTANWWESGISKALTYPNFYESVGKDKIVVIEVYAQFCRFCKDMQPAWDQLAEHYMGANPARKDVLVAKLDGGVEQAICQRYGIGNFPTILIFKKNEIFPAERYNQARTFDGFRDWIERIGGPEEKEPAVEEEKAKPKETSAVKKVEASGDMNEHIHDIYERIDDVARSLSTGRSKGDHNELKDLLNEIHVKIDKKMNSSSADINFKQGIGFLIFGALLGVGISFTYINYHKLGRKRLAD